MNDSLTELYQWARDHLDQLIMFDYVLDKVNGQTPGLLLLLLRQRGSLRPEAEIQIEHTPNRVSPYQATFSALPFTAEIAHPSLLHINLGSQSEVIQWLKTGHKRNRFLERNQDGESENTSLP